MDFNDTEHTWGLSQYNEQLLSVGRNSRNRDETIVPCLLSITSDYWSGVSKCPMDLESDQYQDHVPSPGGRSLTIPFYRFIGDNYSRRDSVFEYAYPVVDRGLYYLATAERYHPQWMPGALPFPFPCQTDPYKATVELRDWLEYLLLYGGIEDGN